MNLIKADELLNNTPTDEDNPYFRCGQQSALKLGSLELARERNMTFETLLGELAVPLFKSNFRCRNFGELGKALKNHMCEFPQISSGEDNNQHILTKIETFHNVLVLESQSFPWLTLQHMK